MEFVRRENQIAEQRNSRILKQLSRGMESQPESPDGTHCDNSTSGKNKDGGIAFTCLNQQRLNWIDHAYRKEGTSQVPGMPAVPKKARKRHLVYLDIVAHVLKENGFPAGSHELAADALDAIRELPGRPKPPPQPSPPPVARWTAS